jgi:shikimate kinase
VSLWLIGYRGSGKTTVASLLADRLSLPAIDADDEIERRAGRTIAAIFASEGEGAFRDLECLVVADLAEAARAGDEAVISLGGGAPLREENRKALRGAGPVIWLKASAETLLARIAADSTTASRRPSLTALQGIDEVRSLLAVREPIYQACADRVIDADGRSPRQIVDEIVAIVGWDKRSAGPPMKAPD